MLSMKFFLPYEPPPEERKSSSAKSPPVKSPQQGSPTSPSLPPSKKGYVQSRHDGGPGEIRTCCAVVSLTVWEAR